MRWLPLESNPEVLNKYLENLGIDSKSCCFVDIYGFDDDLLQFTPRPVLAVMLLYPLTENTSTTMIGEEVGEGGVDGVYFLKQSIGNACGTIGVIHALLNNADVIGFDSKKHLEKFFSSTKSLTPEERGKILEQDTEFGEAHKEVASEGQTRVPCVDDKVDLHFIAFVQHKGEMYELDGRKEGPVDHGSCNEDFLLETSVKVIKEFMQRDPDQVNFTVMALVKQFE